MIALIEDNQGDVLIYQRTFLKGEGFDLFERLDDFLDSKTSYDKVVLDLNLPDSYGLDLVRSVRAKHEGLLIVITGLSSGYLRGKNMHDIIQAGANDVFQKDFISDEAYRKMIEDTLNV